MAVTPEAREVRWGILGAANIARGQFLPGLREAGGGRAALVAAVRPGRGRSRPRTASTAAWRATPRSSSRPTSTPCTWPCRTRCTPSGRCGAAGRQGGALREAAVRRLRADRRRARRGRGARRAAVGGVRLPVPGPAPAADRAGPTARSGSLAEIVSAFHFRARAGNIRLSAAARRRLAGRRGLLSDPAGYEIFGAAAEVTGRPSAGEVEVDAAGIVTWGPAGCC